VSTIASVRATPINVPMVAPYRFSFGTLASFTTTNRRGGRQRRCRRQSVRHRTATFAAVVERLGARLVGLPSMR